MNAVNTYDSCKVTSHRFRKERDLENYSNNLTASSNCEIICGAIVA